MNSLKAKTCCFTGHRDIPAGMLTPLKLAVKEKVLSLLTQDIVYYGVGGAIGFDSLAAETLLELRAEHPQIKVILVYPFEGFDSRWPEEQRIRYRTLWPQYDKRVCVSPMPGREAYVKRDRHLVDHSGRCIAYCTRSYGGTAYTVRYAHSKGCQVYNLAAHQKIF